MATFCQQQHILTQKIVGHQSNHVISHLDSSSLYPKNIPEPFSKNSPYPSYRTKCTPYDWLEQYKRI